MTSCSYFSQSDCFAFQTGQHSDVQGVHDKFLELHRVLHRRLHDRSWDLHPHWEKHALISNRSVSQVNEFVGLALPYTRSHEQAELVERLTGRETNSSLLKYDIARHPVIELRLTPDHFAVELIVSSEALLDQQNLIGKLAVGRHRQALRALIQSLPSDTCIGFWSGIALDQMHLTAGELSYGMVLDEWIGTFQDGHDDLRVGVWYAPQDAALSVENIMSEIIRRIDGLYRVYNFLMWSSNNDFRTFYTKATTYSFGKDARLS